MPRRPDVQWSHGTRKGYREHGCRCDECQAWRRTSIRAFHDARKAETGRPYRSPSRPPRRDFTCDWCGAPLRAGPLTGKAEDGLVLCRRHREQKRSRERGRRNWITGSDRVAIYERDGWVCQLCGEPVDQAADPNSDWAPSLDHVIPRSTTLFADDSPNNLRTVHRWCNSVRGDLRHHTDDDLRPTVR